MTVSATTRKMSYTGTDADADLPTVFVFFTSDEIVVINRVTATGVETTLVEDTHYSVTGGGTPPATGTVSTIDGDLNFLSTSTWEIRRESPLTQTLDYLANDSFPAETHEAGLDHLTLKDQERSEDATRALRFPITESGDGLIPNSVLRASKALTFDATGAPTATTLGTSSGTDITSTRGLTARMLAERFDDTVNVLDFGADSSGTADSTAAVQAALDAAEDDDVVLFPPGIYRCDATLTITDKSLRLQGYGPNSNILFGVGGAVTTGIEGTYTSSFYTFQMADLKLTTWRTEADDTGISLTWPEDLDYGSHPRALFENVTFRGFSAVLSGWEECVHLTQCENATFVNCGFKGVGGDPDTDTQVANTVSATGVFLNGGFPSTGFSFRGCSFYSLYNGIVIGGVVQGVSITSCAMVRVRRGVYWSAGAYSIDWAPDPAGDASGRPGFYAIANYVNCYEHAYELDGVVSVKISDNLLAANGTADQVAVLIQVIDANEVFVHDCEIGVFNTDDDSIGVLFGIDTVRCKAENIAFYIADGVNLEAGVWFADGEAEGCTAKNITWARNATGTITADHLIWDEGGVTDQNTIGNHGALVYIDTAQEIATDTPTLISFTDAVYNSSFYEQSGTDVFWVVGSPTVFTIPIGVHKVRLHAGVKWEGDDTGPADGIRTTEIIKNGALVSGLCGSTLAVNLELNNRIIVQNAISAPIIVETGDVFSLLVYHTSTKTPLDVLATYTWMSIEVLS